MPQYRVLGLAPVLLLLLAAACDGSAGSAGLDAGNALVDAGSLGDVADVAADIVDTAAQDVADAAADVVDAGVLDAVAPDAPPAEVAQDVACKAVGVADAGAKDADVADAGVDAKLIDGFPTPSADAPWGNMTTGQAVACPVPTCNTSAWPSLDAWIMAQKKKPACELDPAATCVGNMLATGNNWAAQIEAKIAAVNAQLLVPFSTGQKQAIRCLAYRVAVNTFSLNADTTVGSPGIELAYTFPSAGKPLADVLAELGPILGALFDLSPDDAFGVGGKVVSPWAGGGGAFEFMARTYKGIPVVSDQITVIVSQVDGCAPLYRLTKVQGRMTRGLANLDLSPCAYLDANAAEAKAAAQCPSCSGPAADPPDLVLQADAQGKPHLTWRIRLPAKVAYKGQTIDWFRRMEVDAHTGSILLDVVDCCLD